MGIVDEPWSKPNPSRVKLLGPVCVSYGHPDLEHIHQYLIDFGLVETFRQKQGTNEEAVFYRGYGVQPVVYIAKRTATPQFLGVYFQAANEEDLTKATKIPGAGQIKDFILGSKEVEVTDPTGMPFHVVFGLPSREFTPPERSQFLPVNLPAPTDRDADAKPRRGKFHRLQKGAIPVHKLGHCGYVAADLDVATDFYTTHFNLRASDIMTTPSPAKVPTMIFFHVNLGQDYSDHHCFFLVRPIGPLTPGVPHHAAFEVENIDSQFIGHEYLEGKGYKSFWGVGRHMEGSQVFDYWFDLDGFVLEHYADGDLVNENNETGYVEIRPESGQNNWGPAVPMKVEL